MRMLTDLENDLQNVLQQGIKPKVSLSDQDAFPNYRSHNNDRLF